MECPGREVPRGRGREIGKKDKKFFVCSFEGVWNSRVAADRLLEEDREKNAVG